MAPGQGRRRKGDRRIDAAIDHFKGKGYDVRDIRSAVAALLKVYGSGPASWPFLEEHSYLAVQEKLFEMEREEKQKQLLLEHHQGDQMEEQHQQEAAAAAGNEALPENDRQQQEAAAGNEALPENDVQVSPENDVQVSQEDDMQVSPENNMHVSGVQNKAPTNISRSALEKQAYHNGSAFLEPVLPLLPAAQAAPAKPVRPPCHGWISEESESESELEDGEILPDIPSTSETLPPRRRGPSRWDVGP